jgi:hypothetical protein
MSALFEARATKERVLHFRECAEYVFSRFAFAKVSIELIAIYFHSFEIFIIQLGEMVFSKPQFIIIKSNYFQNAQKALALVRKHRFLVLLCRREM